ncbi:MAG: hypothetical protein LAO77_01665 [Acidobacteriia bacterium]|nr:hypothetical protein [Terriglobia bacterium]
MGQASCGGTCSNLSTDVNNCGGCGRSCGASAFCISGSCVCAAGTTACSNGCADLTADANNCGACNNRCAVGQTCSAGACVGGGLNDDAAVPMLFSSVPR